MENERPEGIPEGIPILDQGEIFQISCSVVPRNITLVKITTEMEQVEREGQKGYEWYIGPQARGVHHSYFWYSFAEKKAGKPIGEGDIFLVPSHWIAEYLQREPQRGVYFLPMPAAEILRSWKSLFKAAVHDRKVLQRILEVPHLVSFADFVHLLEAMEAIERDGKIDQ